MNLGERIKELRIKKELSQTELATFLNIARSTLSQYESNQRTPSDEIKLKLAEYFDVSVDFLLGKTNNKESTIALHSDTDYKDLPPEAKEEIYNFIDYIKNKYKDKK